MRRTREEILAAAAGLFAERGYAATSTRLIADTVGIRQASLYYHFANKEQILSGFELLPAILAKDAQSQITRPFTSPVSWQFAIGPVFFTVRTGTLTVYEGDDPTCTPHVFTAGTGAVEAATSTHIHMVRN